MEKKIFVAYYRVSTKKQSAEMKPQVTAVKNLLKDLWPPEKSFTEVESGAKNGRPELQKALAYCKEHNATLVVAKLDRLSRDLGFIAHLQDDIHFICADMPQATRETIGFMAVIARWEREQIAKRTKEALAEKKKAGVKLGSHNPKVQAGLDKWRVEKALERENKARLKQLAKAEKAKAKAEGRLEKPVSPKARDIADKAIVPTIKALRLQGFSYQKVTDALNKSGLKARGGGEWGKTQVFRVAKRNGL